MLAQLPRAADLFLASSPQRNAFALMRIARDIQAGSLIEVFAPPSQPRAALPVLEELEQTARGRQCRSMVWTVPHTPRSEAMEPVLHELGWDQGCRLRTFTLDLSRVVEARWMQSLPRANGCEIVPWTGLSVSERETLRAGDWYPASLSPFPQEPQLEPRCSLALRHGGEVAGWSVATRHGAERAYVSVLFVRPDLQGRGVGAALIAETLTSALASGLTSVVFEVEPQRTGMLRFAERRLRPYLIEENTIYRNWKMLS